jgi:hypothetical protein
MVIVRGLRFVYDPALAPFALKRSVASLGLVELSIQPFQGGQEFRANLVNVIDMFPHSLAYRTQVVQSAENIAEVRPKGVKARLY